uniref:Uncharacterized protein n=1 Tax=Globodera rostochiensis TaxID=31243 RepID=A0A914H311_GLORO
MVRSGDFVKEARCMCPNSQLRAIKFSKVKCHSAAPDDVENNNNWRVMASIGSAAAFFHPPNNVTTNDATC